MEQSLQWSAESRAALDRYRADYTALFVDTVREAYLATAPWLNFVDTSPSSSLASTDPYVKRCAVHACSLLGWPVLSHWAMWYQRSHGTPSDALCT